LRGVTPELQMVATTALEAQDDTLETWDAPQAGTG
jgi:hypothetical protein